jgi:hypothetical protein
MTTASYTAFGKTKQIPVVTYTDGKVDTIPKLSWDTEIWIERAEDYYGIPRLGTVRVIERSAWIKC